MFLRLLAALLAAVLLFGQLEHLPPKPGPNVESFEYVWRTVRDKIWDPEIGGLDWQAIHDEFLPQVEKAGTVAETRRILTRMLERLHLSHFQIIPATTYTEIGGSNAALGGDGDLGIDLRAIAGEAVITSVYPDSPAEKAGVSTGWIVRKVDSYELAPIIKSYLSHTPDSTLRELTLRRALLLRLAGPVGESAHVTFLDERNEPVFKNIVRAQPRGQKASIGYLGPAYVWLDARQIPLGEQKVQYIAFNLFLDPANLMPQFGNAVESCMKCAGFVVDLRGNPGGLGAMAMGMAGWFVGEK
ncbi:MAG: PDZ domain-containing protein, partial [Acidobacteriaceae bacterium]|nr:PDZ domain-containing protein [Acidobacteriaceae bacterium]